MDEETRVSIEALKRVRAQEAEKKRERKLNGEKTNNKGAATKQPLHDWDHPDWSILDDRRGALPDFPLDCLSAPVREWVKRAAHGAGVTVAHVAVPAIGIASGLIGMARRVQASRSWSQPATCWTAVVGASGSGKTPGIDTIKRALAQVERNNRNKIDVLRRQHETKSAAAKAAREEWKKGVEEAISAGKNAPQMPEAATDPGKFIIPRLYISNATIERLGELLQARPQGTLLLMDELAGLFMNMSRYSGGEDNTFWLEAWNGGSHTVERMNRSLQIDNLLVGVVGGVQPDKFARSFEGDQDGMYARFLFAWPPAPAYRPLTDEADETDPDIINVMTRLDRLAEFEDDNLVKCSIALSAEARVEFEQLRQFVRGEMEALDGREQEWMAKAQAHALRLAGTLCLLDWASRKDLTPAEAFPDVPTAIGPEYMTAAIRLVQDYFWPHARAALRQSGLSERHENARRALRWIRAHGHVEVSLKDIRLDALGQKLDAEETANLLAAMERSGWVRKKEVKTEGRSAWRWEVNPKLHPDAGSAESAGSPHPPTLSALPALPALPACHIEIFPAANGRDPEGGGAHRRNDLEDCPLAPDGSPDDSFDIPDDLQRCQHCGKPGAKRRNVNGRAVALHEGCSHAWADRQGRTTHSDGNERNRPPTEPRCADV
jgi:hypothetical protein